MAWAQRPNGAGISITANYLESDRDFQQLGVPLSLIRRKVLEQEHFALAIKAVSTTPKSCSNNIMLGMAAGFGVDYECTTDEAFPISGADDLIVHANHWVSEVALAQATPAAPARPKAPTRLARAPAAERSAQADARRSRALFDDFGAPYRVPPPRPGSHDNLSATVAMVVMEPAAGLMRWPAARAEPRLHTPQPAGPLLLPAA